MNKFKKVAVAAVSVVMAGTMAFSFTACDKDKDEETGTLSGLVSIKSQAWSDLTKWYNGSTKYDTTGAMTPNLSNGKLAYDAGMTLDISIGYQSSDTGTRYDTALGNTVDSNVTIAGYSVTKDTFKPAWQGLQSALGLKFSDHYKGTKAGEHISTIKSGDGLDKVGIFTASGSTIITESANDTLLNIAQYLDYMPNYKAFLEQNEVVWASLISNASTGAMYMLPYFDGNNDIEKYVLMRKDLVEKLLDATDLAAATTTFAGQATKKNSSAKAKPTTTADGTKASAESFMGKTGSYTVSASKPGAVSESITVKVDYDAAKTAVNDATSELGKAVRAAYSGVGTLESGNIVDIQNAVINGTSGAVTGAQLLKITQEYIKVAYKYGSSQLYGATVNDVETKLSDVFNSSYAAWDADLYTALGRCYVTCTALLGDANKSEEFSYLVAGRQKTSQRESDLYSLAGELYGVRGLESRNNFAYIDNSGNIKDARADEASWNAVNKLHALAVEGLLDTTKTNPTSFAKSDDTTPQTLSMHDYVQTQTAQGFKKNYDSKDKYNFAPILTPVSNWDVDGNGTAETVMRFTESWRGVKDGGLAVSKSYIGTDAKRLSAVLKFIDYCYSNDGQIMMTYGPKSSTNSEGSLDVKTVEEKDKLMGNTYQNDGMWYATEVTDRTLDQLKTAGVVASHDGEQYYVTAAHQKDYFMFGNKLYTGTSYLGRQIPTMTDESVALFKAAAIGNASFTSYARKYLGTTLPCFNKDQGFEYQCTSECGRDGALIVSDAIVNGHVKHQYQTLNGKSDSGANVGMWYTLVPTTLPFADVVKTALGTGVYRWLTGSGGSDAFYFCVDSKKPANAYISVIKYGFDSTQEVVSGGLKLGSSAADMIAKLEAISQ